MNIKIVPAYSYLEELGSLFSEYVAMLNEVDPSIQSFLAIQNYDTELEHPEIKYGYPHGRLYLAFCDGAVAGCIGLRRLDEARGEIKRFYVRPAYRKNHLGTQLLQKVIADAKEIGYSHLLLDTLPFLRTAIQMYQKAGFYPISRYNDSPLPHSIYLKLDL